MQRRNLNAPPTDAMTEAPTDAMTESPTDAMTEAPTDAMTESPTDTEQSTDTPTIEVTPTQMPTIDPTELVENATLVPTQVPTRTPTAIPTANPTDVVFLQGGLWIRGMSVSLQSLNTSQLKSVSVSIAIYLKQFTGNSDFIKARYIAVRNTRRNSVRNSTRRLLNGTDEVLNSTLTNAPTMLQEETPVTTEVPTIDPTIALGFTIQFFKEEKVTLSISALRSSNASKTLTRILKRQEGFETASVPKVYHTPPTAAPTKNFTTSTPTTNVPTARFPNTGAPTNKPSTSIPSVAPSNQPTASPTVDSTINVTSAPINSPTSDAPTMSPTINSTVSPTLSPTKKAKKNKGKVKGKFKLKGAGNLNQIEIAKIQSKIRKSGIFCQNCTVEVFYDDNDEFSFEFETLHAEHDKKYLENKTAITEALKRYADDAVPGSNLQVADLTVDIKIEDADENIESGGNVGVIIGGVAGGLVVASATIYAYKRHAGGSKDADAMGTLSETVPIELGADANDVDVVVNTLSEV